MHVIQGFCGSIGRGPTLYRRLLVAFAIFLIWCSSSAYAQETFEYLSPRPGAMLVSAETTIGVRQGETIAESSLSNSTFRVEGGKSGLHPGQVILADDEKTVIFQPSAPFSPAEIVTVTIQSGIETTGGTVLGGLTYTFTVSPNSLTQRRTLPETNHEVDWGGGNQSLPVTTGALVGNPTNYATLAADFPFVTVTAAANQTGDGLLFLNNTSNRPPHPYLLILDDNGEPVFYRKMAPGVRYSDFRKQVNGLLTYHDGAAEAYKALDSSYRMVDTYRAGNGYVIDGHGIEIAENGHILLQIYDEQPVDMSQLVSGGLPDATVVGVVIQELDPSRNVIFEWRSWDHFLITDASDDIDLTATGIRASHSNAAVWDNDGNILVSFRNRDEITKINRRTAEIIWQFGGKRNDFTLIGDDRPFSHQHDVRRLPNGNLTLYDNGNNLVPEYSRGVEYQIDEVNRTATKVWEYRHQPTDAFGRITGSMQRLPNGNTLIDWGGDSGLPPIFTEVKPDGSKALEMYFVNQERSYRTYRQPWEGHPNEAPTLVLTTHSVTGTLHYSWNGATETASYRVHGGPTTRPDEMIDTPVKSSFETTTLLSQASQTGCYFYRVMPIDKDANETIYSNIVFAGDASCELVAVLTPTEAISKTFTTTPADPNLSTTIHASAGIVSETTTLVYTQPDPIERLSPAGLTATRLNFVLTAHQSGNPQADFVFNEPLSVELAYSEDSIAGLNESTLAVYWWSADRQAWINDGLVVTERDPLNNRLRFTTEHLTQFGVFAQRSSEPISYMDLIQDGSFEAERSAWQQMSSNLPFVICDSECHYAGVSQAHSGKHWVSFAGGAKREDAYISQDIAIPAGEIMTTTLSFWLRIPSSSNTGEDVLRVSIGGRDVFTVSNTDQTAFQYKQYAKVDVDVTEQARTASNVRFDALIQANSQSAFYVDDVALTIAGVLTPETYIYLPSVIRP